MRDNTNTRERDTEFVERVIQIKRVSKKTSGGNTISFAALVVVGDLKGQVGVGYGKARDVSTAIAKGIGTAKKNLVSVPIHNGSIAHDIQESYGSAKVLLMPAPQGAGVIAGGTVRIVVELAGIQDISAKMLGSSNKICNIRCTISALSKLKK